MMEQKRINRLPSSIRYTLIEKECGELIYKEHLGISGTDQCRALAEQLCQDIPMKVCTLAYSS